MPSPSCLNQPDILLLICEELLSSSSYGSLAAFAAANSLICDVALDALWAKQDSLVPLLKILVNYQIVQEIHDQWVRPLTLVLQGTIDSVAWARMKNYAARIRELELQGRCGALSMKCPELSLEGHFEIDIERATLERVSVHAEPTPIFPRLKVLDWTMPDPALKRLVPMLFSPSISKVKIRSMHCAWLVRRLPTFCPRLTELSIWGNLVEIALPYSNILTDALRQLQYLESVDISTMRPDILLLVDQLPSLRSLEFTLGIQFTTRVDGRPPPSRLALTKHMPHITINLEDPVSLDRFFRIVHCPLKITAFDVRCYEDSNCGTFDARQHNLEVIARSLDPAYVRQILYYHDCDIDLEWGPVPARSLLLLTRHPHLTFLGVDCWLDVGDADLIVLARGLPLLEFLVLDTHASQLTMGHRDYLDLEARNVRTTLAVLPAFAHHCPHLRALCIRLDAVDVPQLAASADDAPRVQHPVRLYFAESPLEDPNAVALFLKRVFVRGCSVASRPLREGMHKQHLDHFWEDDGDTTKEWPVGEWPAVRQRLLELAEGEV